MVAPQQARAKEKEREKLSEAKSGETQHRRPGLEAEMKPRPESANRQRRGSGRLESRVALISGADSGIGSAVAVLFAREGADIAFAYLNEHKDAEETVRLVTAEGRRCIKLAGDVGN